MLTDTKVLFMSKNKVYYGEYTLKHWIDLILSNNIVLPEYQRLFVWDNNKVVKLIDSFSKDCFVPPVTIGSYKKDSKQLNLIIDGQQRLTSLLLAYLSIYPKEDCFKPSAKDMDSFADENDDFNDDENSILGWTFNELLKKGDKKEIIKKAIENTEKENYCDLGFDIAVDDEFLENHYLGSCYLIPQENQQQYFSSVFRDINAEGKKLTALETRKSLYFLADGFNDFFDPACIHGITIKKDDGVERIDFVRYLALLFQYNKNGYDSVAKNYGRKLEEYYEKFIDATINQNNDSDFTVYDVVYKNRLQFFDAELKTFGLNKKVFPSIIDADIYMFGLIYYILLKNKQLDATKKENLFNDLNTKINELKENPNTGYLHKKTPSALKYLRQRILGSINIYGKYLK